MLRPLYRALINSIDGLRYGITERAIRQEAFLLLVAVPLAPVIAGSLSHTVLLIAVLLAVLCVELLNTAIERLCDIVQPDLDPRIKGIKDMSSAACFCMQIIAGLVWAHAVLARVLASRL